MRIDFCEFLDDLLYDLETNVWVKVNQKDGVTLGITSVHAALAGRLNQIKLKALGESVAKGKNVGDIESVKYFNQRASPKDEHPVFIRSSTKSAWGSNPTPAPTDRSLVYRPVNKVTLNSRSG